VTSLLLIKSSNTGQKRHRYEIYLWSTTAQTEPTKFVGATHRPPNPINIAVLLLAATGCIFQSASGFAGVMSPGTKTEGLDAQRVYMEQLLRMKPASESTP